MVKLAIQLLNGLEGHTLLGSFVQTMPFKTPEGGCEDGSVGKAPINYANKQLGFCGILPSAAFSFVHYVHCFLHRPTW